VKEEKLIEICSEMSVTINEDTYEEIMRFKLKDKIMDLMKRKT
jgi:hypothetical protein